MAKKSAAKAKHRITESDDDTVDSDKTQHTTNAAEDNEWDSTNENETPHDDEDNFTNSAPVSLAKDIEQAEQELDVHGVSINSSKKTHKITNPHSAQSKLDHALDPDSFESRLAQLTAAAAEKAAQRKQRAIQKRAKHRRKAAQAALQKKKSPKKPKSRKQSSSSSTANEIRIIIA